MIACKMCESVESTNTCWNEIELAHESPSSIWGSKGRTLRFQRHSCVYKSAVGQNHPSNQMVGITKAESPHIYSRLSESGKRTRVRVLHRNHLTPHSISLLWTLKHPCIVPFTSSTSLIPPCISKLSRRAVRRTRKKTCFQSESQVLPFLWKLWGATLCTI